MENPTTPQQQMASVLAAFCDLARLHDVIVPADYLENSIKAMKCLKECGRSNVLYLLAKSLATPRSDGKGSKFPITRMPMGLLEYLVNFFDADNLQNVSGIRIKQTTTTIHNVLKVPKCPDDYRSLLVTMYSLMGTKWCKLHAGPMWSGQQVPQGVAPKTTHKIEEVHLRDVYHPINILILLKLNIDRHM